MVDERAVATRFEALRPFLDERTRRLWAGAEASAIGRGGIEAVHPATSLARETIRAGLADLHDPALAASGRVRRVGGGRSAEVDKDPGLLDDQGALVEADTLGDPQSPLLWVSKSVRHLAAELVRQGHKANRTMVGELLRGMGYSLQANVKTREGSQHPDRDAQFRYLAEQVRSHLDAGQPVVSVDTKKKELVGEYRIGGQEWQPQGQPVATNVHDFIGPEGKAIPYGVYDVAADAAWVSVGRDHDTAAFAVATLRRWWQAMGAAAYPSATRLLVCADGGGSNSYRTRLWKVELARLAAEVGLTVTVCHLPPGTSKWNKIEHRLFSHISMNWRGRPLTSHEVVVQLIAATTTRSGLSVQAELDEGVYPKGVKISDQDMAALPLTNHDFHGDWNYTLAPAAPEVTST